jgi:hypothetical protein
VKNERTVLLAILVTAVAAFALIAPVSAVFVHPRGILITTYPQDLVVFWGRVGTYPKNLAVVIKPPWYFVDDFTGFDSVTLKVTLATNCFQCRQYGGGDPPILAGADATGQLVVQWSRVTMSEEDNGALLECPLNFVITARTTRGYYMLYLSATAQSSGVTFYGWDQVPVSVVP